MAESAACCPPTSALGGWREQNTHPNLPGSPEGKGNACACALLRERRGNACARLRALACAHARM
eukprot:10114968-Alexandrium_andersonii.AAC.1